MGLALPGVEGRAHLAGKLEDPQGASDPQGRVSEPLQHHAMHCCCSVSCSPELGAMLEGGGLASPSHHHQLPPSLSQDPATRLAPQAALPLGDIPQGAPLTC